MLVLFRHLLHFCVFPVQEKHYQSLEKQRQLQELTLVREEKRQLANELEARQSKDKQLRDRISKLEAILHKVALIYTKCLLLLPQNEICLLEKSE